MNIVCRSQHSSEFPPLPDSHKNFCVKAWLVCQTLGLSCLVVSPWPSLPPSPDPQDHTVPPSSDSITVWVLPQETCLTLPITTLMGIFWTVVLPWPAQEIVHKVHCEHWRNNNQACAVHCTVHALCTCRYRIAENFRGPKISWISRFAKIHEYFTHEFFNKVGHAPPLPTRVSLHVFVSHFLSSDRKSSRK